VAGAAVGSIVAASLVAGGTLQVPIKRDTSDASAAFLDAWKRSRTGTFVVESDFRRVAPDGRVLASQTELVQRPPDRVVRQFGGVSGVVGGHPIVCNTDPRASYTCMPGTTSAPDFTTALDTEMATLRTYVTPPALGALPLYTVSPGQDAGCFELYQGARLPDAPWGHHARMCFDAATGALRLLERDLDAGFVETQESTSISTNVLTSDFDVSAPDDDYGTRLDLGDPTSVPPIPSTSVPTGSTPPGTAPDATSPDGTTSPGTAPAGSVPPGDVNVPAGAVSSGAAPG
jgi:hypothetical protein